MEGIYFLQSYSTPQIIPSHFLSHYFLFVYGVYHLLGDLISSLAICFAIDHYLKTWILVTSYFIVDVEETDNVIAAYPSTCAQVYFSAPG